MREEEELEPWHCPKPVSDSCLWEVERRRRLGVSRIITLKLGNRIVVLSVTTNEGLRRAHKAGRVSQSPDRLVEESVNAQVQCRARTDQADCTSRTVCTGDCRRTSFGLDSDHRRSRISGCLAKNIRVSDSTCALLGIALEHWSYTYIFQTPGQRASQLLWTSQGPCRKQTCRCQPPAPLSSHHSLATCVA